MYRVKKLTAIALVLAVMLSMFSMMGMAAGIEAEEEAAAPAEETVAAAGGGPIEDTADGLGGDGFMSASMVNGVLTWNASAGWSFSGSISVTHSSAPAPTGTVSATVSPHAPSGVIYTAFTWPNANYALTVSYSGTKVQGVGPTQPASGSFTIYSL